MKPNKSAVTGGRMIFTGLVLASVLLAIPAMAASPHKGTYADYTPAHRLVLSLDVKGRRVYPTFPFSQSANYCTSTPIEYSAKVKDSGKFKFDRTVKDVTGERVAILLRGKFKTSKLAVGTVRYGNPDIPCEGKKVHFEARYKGKG